MVFRKELGRAVMTNLPEMTLAICAWWALGSTSAWKGPGRRQLYVEHEEESGR